MKKILSAFFGLSMVFASQARAVPVVATHDAYVSIHDVLVPDEPKTTGENYVVVSGMFSNSCYRWKGAEVTNKSDLVHEVRVMATVSETMCLMVLVPFSHEVILGKLAQGQHTLRFMNGDGTYFERTMNVP